MAENKSEELQVTVTTDSKELRNNGSLDKGYAWVIVFASFWAQFVGDGTQCSFGIFFTEISVEFRSAGKSGVSWIASIMIAAMHAAGPLGSILVNKFSCRTVSIIGSLLAATGFSLSYFATSVPILYITIGLIGGLGFGLLYLPAMVIVPQFFKNRRAFAVGISVCGTGLGTFAFEIIFGFLLQKFSWRQTLAIGAALILCTIFTALLYRPGPNQAQESLESASTKKEGNPLCCSCLPRGVIDLTLLANPLFLIFSTCDILTSIGFVAPFLYLPDIEKEETDSTRSTLLGIIGVTNVLSRLVLGYISDKPCVNRLFVYISALVIAGAGTTLIPHLLTIWCLRGYAGLIGTCMGTYISLKSIILVDLVGVNRITDAFGIMLLIQSMGFIIGPPIVGLLYDIYGIYKPGFYFAGATQVASGIILTSIPILKRKYMRNSGNIADAFADSSKNGI